MSVPKQLIGKNYNNAIIDRAYSIQNVPGILIFIKGFENPIVLKVSEALELLKTDNNKGN